MRGSIMSSGPSALKHQTIADLTVLRSPIGTVTDDVQI